MSDLKDKQYGDSTRFNARINLHAKYSENRYLFPHWVLDNIGKTGNARVLELGCGNALLWTTNAGRIPENWNITLSDFSGGMLEDARRNTAALEREFLFRVIDTENIPCYDKSFDIIIANNMLYHVPDRVKAASEIKRVLADEGTFYATTLEHGYMKEMGSLLREYRTGRAESPNNSGVIENFSLQNGEDQLRDFFNRIELRIYNNRLIVTDAEPFTQFVISCNDIMHSRILLHESEKDRFTEFVDKKIKSAGSITVPADAGIFICRNDRGI